MGARSDGVRKVTRRGKPHWLIDFRFCDKEGRRQRYSRDASIQSATGARAEAQRLKRLAIETGSPYGRPPTMTFAHFVETKFRTVHMPAYCRPATRERYEALLRQGVLATFGSKRLDEIGGTAIRGYEAELAARKVQARGHISLVRTILRSAVDLGALEVLPDLPPLPRQGRKLPDAPSEEDVAAMLTSAHGWLHLAIALSVFAGVRMGEVRALAVCDVDFKAGNILVRNALSADEVVAPKSGHQRVVPIATPLLPILEAATRSKPPAARLVVNGNGHTPSRQNVLTAMKALEKRIGIREWSFHALRHYFISTLVRRGVSIEAIRMLAGHSKLDVTQRYVHATAADLKAAIAKL